MSDSDRSSDLQRAEISPDMFSFNKSQWDRSEQVGPLYALSSPEAAADRRLWSED